MRSDALIEAIAGAQPRPSVALAASWHDCDIAVAIRLRCIPAIATIFTLAW
jgi:hypothetical protein